MKSAFLGFNKKQVDRYLELQKKDHQEKKDRIMSNISNLRSENDLLLEELSALKQENEHWALKKEYLETAEERINKAVSLLKSLSEDEINIIMELSKQKMSVYNEKVSREKDEMQHARSDLDMLLKSILKLLNENDEKEKYEGLDKAAENLRGKVLPYILRTKTQDKNDIPFLEGPPGKKKETKKNGTNMDKKLDDISFWENIEDEKITADGSVIQQKTGKFITSNSVFNKPGAISKTRNSPKKEDKDNTTIGQDSKLAENRIKPSGTFWDGIEELVLVPETQTNITSIPPEEPKTVGCANKEQSFTVKEKAPADEPAKKSSLLAGGDGDFGSKSIPTVNKEPSTGKETKGAGSAAVTQEIEAIRQRYIVGKLAGEDLYDSSGNLIIPKNSVITPAIITEAEKQGKLSELIVNMILPGME